MFEDDDENDGGSYDNDSGDDRDDDDDGPPECLMGCAWYSVDTDKPAEMCTFLSEELEDCRDTCSPFDDAVIGFYNSCLCMDSIEDCGYQQLLFKSSFCMDNCQVECPFVHKTSWSGFDDECGVDAIKTCLEDFADDFEFDMDFALHMANLHMACMCDSEQCMFEDKEDDDEEEEGNPDDNDDFIGGGGTGLDPTNRAKDFGSCSCDLDLPCGEEENVVIDDGAKDDCESYEKLGCCYANYILPANKGCLTNLYLYLDTTSEVMNGEGLGIGSTFSYTQIAGIMNGEMVSKIEKMCDFDIDTVKRDYVPEFEGLAFRSSLFIAGLTMENVGAEGSDTRKVYIDGLQAVIGVAAGAVAEQLPDATVEVKEITIHEYISGRSDRKLAARSLSSDSILKIRFVSVVYFPIETKGGDEQLASVNAMASTMSQTVGNPNFATKINQQLVEVDPNLNIQVLGVVTTDPIPMAGTEDDMAAFEWDTATAEMAEDEDSESDGSITEDDDAGKFEEWLEEGMVLSASASHVDGGFFKTLTVAFGIMVLFVGMC